jgi:hypothetical protein
MVLALDQGNGLASMKEKDVKKWLGAHEKVKTGEAATYPDTQLDYFLELYKKVKLKPYMCNYGAEPFVPINHDDYIVELNNLRNGFIHFQVGAWQIEKSLVKESLLKGVEVISFLIDSPAFPWHHRRNASIEREALHRDLKSIFSYLVV